MPGGRPDDASDPWRDLAARAATLGERLAGAVHVEPGDDPALADARLARWREVAARGDAARFAAVLAAHGLTDEAAAHRLLGESVHLPPGTPLPGWVRVARRLSRRSPVRHARATLRRRVGPEIYAGLSRRAHAALEGHLAARLDEAAAGARDLEQRVRRALREGNVSGPDADPPPDAEAEIPWSELFPHYPVLARLAAGLVRDWVTAQAEFLRRLHRDRPRLAATFLPEAGVAAPLGPVTGLEAGAGDAHRGGRSVLLLRFAGGRRLVYKPRDVHPERVWCDAVTRLHAAGFRPTLRAARVLPRGRGGAAAYGWMEWVPTAPRRGRAERARYGRRAGALTAWFHVLGGTDGHGDNVVAAGEHPVLVDLETLAHPSPPAPANGRTDAVKTFRRSVLRTLLLPVPEAFLPGEPERPADPAAPVLWVPPAGFERRPHDDGGPPPARPRLDVPRRAFLAGFRAMARFLVSPAGRRLRRVCGRALTGRTVRRVPRATAFYAELRHRSVSARCLRDGADRGIEWEWLRRVEAGVGETPADVAAEIQALEGLDIPYFTAPARLPDDAPWLVANAPALGYHLGEQAKLLAEVLAATRR